MTAVAPASAKRKKVSDRAAVARAVTAVRLAGPAGMYPAQVRDAMAVGRARATACMSAAIAEGLIARGPAGVLVACPPDAFGGNSSHAIVRAGRLAERTHRLLRAPKAVS